VTCAKILAATYARLGKHVQAFGDYAGERSGAPVRAYARVSDTPVTSRNKVYQPDHLLVLDHRLLGPEVTAGLAPGGSLLLNTPYPLAEYDGRFEGYRLATVDATAIARRRGIGTRSVVIVNTTLAGAFARLHGIHPQVLAEVYRALGLSADVDAAREAYAAVQVRPARARPALEWIGRRGAAPPEPVDVEPLTEHRESPPAALATGAWRTQRPVYVEHLAPCNAWCPAGNDVVGFVQTVAREGEARAADVLGATTPLAGTCGRVCPAPCMEGCNRAELDGAVDVRGLERWIADRAMPAAPAPTFAPRAGAHRVAIVGGGPAGLSAAHALARAGHRAAIYESEDVLGGVLATGIPAYRLPRDVVRREVAAVLALGVEAKTGQRIDRAGLALLADDYDAVILATGLQRPRAIDVPGAELAGIEQGLAFLRRRNLGLGGVDLAGHVVVLGGGNTAVDCARSALRSGAARVTLAYRRTRSDMPAIRAEVGEALEEGVELLALRQPVGFHGERRVAAVELAEVEQGPPDETGRRRPDVTGRTQVLPCDAVLLALGQSADARFLPDGWTLEGERVYRGAHVANVVAAGDLATGDGTVAHAIGSGRRAAGLALELLGEDVAVFERPDRSRAVPATAVKLDRFARRAPAREDVLPLRERAASFREVHRGLADGREAERCFSCGRCTRCDTCLVYCPEGVVRRGAEHAYEIDATFCKGCGICVAECPRSAMEMTT
jgi:2-oxoacid:acceptor oxidoreductase gamma subunit (pyruvate/2-ketoisovalerate family)/2-oxoacid:acceptor oxidoreductase delta subunit (pyruvate/2-ketoisovalerate family)